MGRAMGRVAVSIWVGLVVIATGVAAEPSERAAPMTADAIIASISARVRPTYIKDVRDFGRAALNLSGQERLRRLFLVENEIGDIDDTETPEWNARLKAVATQDHDRRYMRLADAEAVRLSATEYGAEIRQLLQQFSNDPDWFVRIYALQMAANHIAVTGRPDTALKLIDKARAQVPAGDPDARRALNILSKTRAYVLSLMGDTTGVLTAMTEAEFQYRLPEGPIGAIDTLNTLLLEGVNVNDERMSRSAYATLSRMVPVGDNIGLAVQTLRSCQRIEETFGTPERVLSCGRGLDWPRVLAGSPDRDQAEFLVASRGLAYAQIGRTQAAEQDAAQLRELARTGVKMSDIPVALRLDAWLSARNGHAVEAVQTLDTYWRGEMAAKKSAFRNIVPELTGALQRDLDLARRNEQQQSTIILFQWGMGAVAALICAAALAILIWQRRLNAALSLARQRAEEVNALKSQFLANVSHEVRTPLNGVLGMIQAMAADELNPVQRERLEVLRGSSRGMLTILNDLLDLAKIEAGKLTLESVEFDLAAVAEGSRHAFWAAAEAKGLALELTVEDEARGLYRGDPTRLRQVVDNLVSNAIKFTTEGGVHVTFASTGAGLRLTVRDTGIGMTPEQAGKIFAKFEQADASTTRKYGGTGLGLSICRELVLAFGGEISVSSTPGQGTVFTAELPLPRIGDSPAGAAEPSAAEAAGLEEAGEGLRILAAEDHPVNQLVLRTLLSQLGCEVTLVGDGAQALEAFRAGRWDVVLMDIQMPVMDGLEATRAIRALERAEGAARTPLVALTANAMPDQIAQYRAAGFDDHLSKPIDAGELLAVLNRALAGYAAAPEMALA